MTLLALISICAASVAQPSSAQLKLVVTTPSASSTSVITMEPNDAVTISAESFLSEAKIAFVAYKLDASGLPIWSAPVVMHVQPLRRPGAASFNFTAINDLAGMKFALQAIAIAASGEIVVSNLIMARVTR